MYLNVALVTPRWTQVADMAAARYFLFAMLEEVDSLEINFEGEALLG